MRWLVLLALPLASCIEPQPPRWADVCVSSHAESRYGYHCGLNVLNGGKYECSMQHYTEVVCDATEHRCLTDRHYEGPETCESARNN